MPDHGGRGNMGTDERHRVGFPRYYDRQRPAATLASDHD
jgi:hypothetical protein